MEAKVVAGQPFVLNGRWLFDRERDCISDLQQPGRNRALSPVATRLLAVMAQATRTTMTRRKLFDECWRRYGLEVCDNSLSQVILQLRDAFCELDPGQPYIKTIPRIGYCLLADVQCAPQFAAVAGHLTQSTTGRRQAGRELLEREAFEVQAGHEWRGTERSGQPLSLLMITAEAEQTACNSPPEAIRQLLAVGIRECIHRPDDCAGRYEEGIYAVLLPETDAQGAMKVSANIRRAVLGMDTGYDRKTAPRVTVRVGLACAAQRRYETQQAWIDAALYTVQHGMLPAFA